MNLTFGIKRDNLLEHPEFLSGVATGALIGLAIGILIAPRSGKKLRSEIADAVSKRTDDIADKWDETKSEAKKEIDNVKTKASDSAEKAAEQLDKYEDKIADGVDHITHKAEVSAGDLADGTKSTIDKVKDDFKIG